ncbi:hypothetical protein LINPERPRIM_LOCUS31382 [Linum perenne]
MEIIAPADDPRTTSELVLSLWKHFQASEYENVAGILVSREEKMKREIEKMRREKDLLEGMITSLEVQRLNKIHLEDELRRVKQACLGLKHRISHLKLENVAFKCKHKETEARVARILQAMDGGVETEENVNSSGTTRPTSAKVVFEKKWSSDTGANNNACSDETKITRQLGSAPVLSQARETMDAGQSSRSN